MLGVSRWCRCWWGRYAIDFCALGYPTRLEDYRGGHAPPTLGSLTPRAINARLAKCGRLPSGPGH